MTDIDETIRRVPDLIARVRELDAAATKGPWDSEYDGDRYGFLGYVIVVDTCYEEHATDAALIAYYRTAAPLLADECERLQTELEMIRDAAADAIRDGEQVAFTVRTLHVLRTVLRGSE